MDDLENKEPSLARPVPRLTDESVRTLPCHRSAAELPNPALLSQNKVTSRALTSSRQPLDLFSPTASGQMGAVSSEGSSQCLSKTSMNGRRLGGISSVDIVEERFISRPLADSAVLAARNSLEKAGALLPLNARFPFSAFFR